MGCGASNANANAHENSFVAQMEYNASVYDTYDVVEKIGVGQQGTVYRARERASGQTVAMKETHIGAFGANAKRREAYCEIETLGKMKHPNVAMLIKAYQTSAEVHVVMEYCGENTLLSYLVALDDASWVTEKEKGELRHALTRQIVDAVAHVHSKDVVFRDLKHENVMVMHDDKLRNVVVKLVDFGRAASLRRGDRLNNQPPLGTSLFQAPEVEQRREYGQAADMWAVGVFVYFLATGKMPFEHTVAGLYKVFRGEYEPMDDTFSRHARDLVSKLLVVDPSKRINAAQASTHKYLRQEFESHVHVSEGDALRVPLNMVQEAKKQLRALVMQESLERHTVGLLAEKLSPDDLKMLQRWLVMKAERSVHRGSANLRLAPKVHDEEARTGMSPEASTREGHQYADEVKAHIALNTLYKELANASGSNSLESSFHDGRITKAQSFSNLSEALSKCVEDEDAATASKISSANSVPTNLKKKVSPGKQSAEKGRLSTVSTASLEKALEEDEEEPTGYSERSFIGFAHATGMCTVDELISACISAGLPAVAIELQAVRDKLKEERKEKLKTLGTDSQTQESSVLLDIMLFRHEDLLSKVENIQLERMKDLSVRHGDASAFEGTAASSLANNKAFAAG